MKQLNWKRIGIVAVIAVLLLAVVSVQAQEERGTIRGGVYQDVNGDGACVNTGVAGEDPVAGVDIQFVSSDRATTVTLQSGENGTFGLAAAGQSIWEVTARPDASRWIVTSENPLFVPVLPETGMVQTDVNFCVSQGTNAIIVLPESGAAGQPNTLIVWLTAVAGLGLLLVGAGLEVRRHRA